MLGNDLLDRPRHGRMRLRGRWVHFPLKPADLARNLPIDFTAGALRDAVFKPRQNGEETFASVLERGLGRTICRDFYFPYARKIWGVDPAELDAEQARRRVSAGSVGKLIRKVLKAVPGLKPKGGGRFYYPRNGFGAISDAYCDAAVQSGATVRFDARVAGIEAAGPDGLTVHIQTGSGFERIPAKQVLSTIPISALIRLVDPPAPEAVQKAACELKFRSMILIYLVLETEQFTEFDAHYFPDSRARITRLSEPKNYGLAALPGRTVLCAELPCLQQDPVWKASDQDLGKLVCEDLAQMGIPVKVPVKAVATRRLPQAYPIYNKNYRATFDRMDAWVGEINGLITFGRQGLFAHDNTHHALAMAYALEQCLNDCGELDRSAWKAHRRKFEEHVVED